MFWKKALGFGLLAAVCNAAPLDLSLRGLEDLQNATALVSKRAFQDPTEDGFFYRGDSRNPKQIEQTNGFKSKAITHENTKDPSLYNHCNGDPLDPWYTVDTDGYISTSQLFSVAVRYLNGNEKGAIYKIAPHDNLVSCQDALGRHNPKMSEFEFSGIDHIPFDQIVGWWYPVKLHPKNKNEVEDAKYNPNPHYKGDKHYLMSDIKPKPELAQFPPGHEALKHEPWKSLQKPKTSPGSSKGKGKDNGKGKGKGNGKSNSKSQGTGKGKKPGSSSTRRSISIFLRDMMDMVRNPE